MVKNNRLHTQGRLADRSVEITAPFGARLILRVMNATDEQLATVEKAMESLGQAASTALTEAMQHSEAAQQGE